MGTRKHPKRRGLLSVWAARGPRDGGQAACEPGGSADFGSRSTLNRWAPFFPGSFTSDESVPLASRRITVRRLFPIAFANSGSVIISSAMAQSYAMAQCYVNYPRQTI